jgi:hypothetical protein
MTPTRAWRKGHGGFECLSGRAVRLVAGSFLWPNCDCAIHPHERVPVPETLRPRRAPVRRGFLLHGLSWRGFSVD